MRAFHLLRGLAKEHEVHLVALAKDPADVQHKEALEQWFSSVEIVPLHPLFSKLYALCCLFLFLPLTLGFFYSLRAKKIIKGLAQKHEFDTTLAFCSSTAHYCQDVPAQMRIVDFVDIDSEKWRQYASIHSMPKSLIYQYEYIRLQAVERKIHLETTLSLVTSDIEKERLKKLSGENGSRIVVIPQGVALDFYQQQQATRKPKRLVFTGQMDYLPNIDGLIYFYNEVFPLIKAQEPEVELYIVGRNASEQLREACPDAVVTGEVNDIRPHLHSATVVVAPLRLAFGMQSKILEAMASGIPVVASDKAAQSLWAEHAEHLLVAKTTQEFADNVLSIFADQDLGRKLSEASKQYVQQFHDWKVLLEPLLDLIRKEKEEESEIAELANNVVSLTDGCERAL